MLVTFVSFEIFASAFYHINKIRSKRGGGACFIVLVCFPFSCAPLCLCVCVCFVYAYQLSRQEEEEEDSFSRCVGFVVRREREWERDASRKKESVSLRKFCCWTLHKKRWKMQKKNKIFSIIYVVLYNKKVFSPIKSVEKVWKNWYLNILIL